MSTQSPNATLQGGLTYDGYIQKNPTLLTEPPEIQADVAWQFFNNRMAEQPGWDTEPQEIKDQAWGAFREKYNVPDFQPVETQPLTQPDSTGGTWQKIDAGLNQVFGPAANALGTFNTAVGGITDPFIDAATWNLADQSANRQYDLNNPNIPQWAKDMNKNVLLNMGGAGFGSVAGASIAQAPFRKFLPNLGQKMMGMGTAGLYSLGSQIAPVMRGQVDPMEAAIQVPFDAASGIFGGTGWMGAVKEGLGEGSAAAGASLTTDAARGRDLNYQKALQEFLMNFAAGVGVGKSLDIHGQDVPQADKPNLNSGKDLVGIPKLPAQTSVSATIVPEGFKGTAQKYQNQVQQSAGTFSEGGQERQGIQPVETDESHEQRVKRYAGEYLAMNEIAQKSVRSEMLKMSKPSVKDEYGDMVPNPEAQFFQDVLIEINRQEKLAELQAKMQAEHNTQKAAQLQIQIEQLQAKDPVPGPPAPEYVPPPTPVIPQPVESAPNAFSGTDAVYADMVGKVQAEAQANAKQAENEQKRVKVAGKQATAQYFLNQYQNADKGVMSQATDEQVAAGKDNAAVGKILAHYNKLKYANASTSAIKSNLAKRSVDGDAVATRALDEIVKIEQSEAQAKEEAKKAKQAEDQAAKDAEKAKASTEVKPVSPEPEKKARTDEDVQESVIRLEDFEASLQNLETQDKKAQAKAKEKRVNALSRLLSDRYFSDKFVAHDVLESLGFSMKQTVLPGSGVRAYAVKVGGKKGTVVFRYNATLSDLFNRGVSPYQVAKRSIEGGSESNFTDFIDDYRREAYSESEAMDIVGQMDEGTDEGARDRDEQAAYYQAKLKQEALIDKILSAKSQSDIDALMDDITEMESDYFTKDDAEFWNQYSRAMGIVSEEIAKSEGTQDEQETQTEQQDGPEQSTPENKPERKENKPTSQSQQEETVDSDYVVMEEWADQYLREAGFDGVDDAKSVMDEYTSVYSSGEEVAALKAELEAFGKGSRDPKAKALRDKIKSIEDARKVRKKELAARLEGVDPNVKAVLKTEADFRTGIGKQLEPDNGGMTWDDVKDSIPEKYQAWAKKIDQAMRESKVLWQEYHANRTGHTSTLPDKAVSPFSWAMTKGDNPTPMYRAYNSEGQPTTYHIDETMNGKQVDGPVSRMASEPQVIDEPAFVGEYYNVYKGPGEYKLADVLNRGERQSGMTQAEIDPYQKKLGKFSDELKDVKSAREYLQKIAQESVTKSDVQDTIKDAWNRPDDYEEGTRC